MNTSDIVTCSDGQRVEIFRDAFDYIATLHPRDRDIINYWIAGYTLDEIGEDVGLDASNVCRTIQKITQDLG